MSREILFRGKEINNNFWVYGDLLTHEGFQHNEVDIRDYFQHRQCVVNSSTIGQFTGLTDKNGTKIFEGDIIKIPEDWDKYGINAGELFEVYFTDGGFRLKPKIYKDCRGFWLEDDGEFEIISNIHDNPKLLKED